MRFRAATDRYGWLARARPQDAPYDTSGPPLYTRARDFQKVNRNPSCSMRG